MTLIKKCTNCSTYTFKKECPKCSKETKDPHYKFKKVRDAPTGNFRRRSSS